MLNEYVEGRIVRTGRSYILTDKEMRITEKKTLEQVVKIISASAGELLNGAQLPVPCGTLLETDCVSFVSLSGRAEPVECNAEKMIFRFADKTITVTGNGLIIGSFSEITVRINGKIFGMEIV